MNIRVNDTYTVYPVDACNWSIIQRTPAVDEDGKPIIREKKLTKSAAQAPSFKHGVKPHIAVRR